METLVDLSNISTNIRQVFLRLCDHPTSYSVANHLKIYYIFTNYACYNCIEFRKNSMNAYRVIKILCKKKKLFFYFLCGFFPFNSKGFSKFSKQIFPKYIKIIILNFKTNAINIQRDVDIFSKYF